MAFLKPYLDPTTREFAPNAYWDIKNVELDLTSKHAVITLQVWWDNAAHDAGYTPFAEIPPRALRPDEFDQIITLAPLPPQITLAQATKGFAAQVLKALPEFNDAVMVP